MCMEECQQFTSDMILVSFGGHLLAIGGRDNFDNPTSDVYGYDYHTDSWSVASQMKNRQSFCISYSVSEDHLIVLGGCTYFQKRTNILRSKSEC